MVVLCSQKLYMNLIDLSRPPGVIHPPRVKMLYMFEVPLTFCEYSGAPCKPQYKDIIMLIKMCARRQSVVTRVET
jgi:hypothetical protein